MTGQDDTRTQGRPVTLTIAGSDSGGGAGIVADVRTFAAYGVWPAVAVTAVTAQNTLGVQTAEALTPEMVSAQIASVASDLGVDAAKTGMLATADIVEAVAATVKRLGVGPLVVDPVLVSTQGDRLLDLAAIEALRDRLTPLATVITPNLAELGALTGHSFTGRDGMAEGARYLLEAGANAVLVTGGDLEGDVAADCLLTADDGEPVWLEARRSPGASAHGTGCVLSAAICAGLATGLDLLTACRRAKGFVSAAITSAVRLGEGPPSVDPGSLGERESVRSDGSE